LSIEGFPAKWVALKVRTGVRHFDGLNNVPI
jgi:hypothetical protein